MCYCFAISWPTFLFYSLIMPAVSTHTHTHTHTRACTSALPKIITTGFSALQLQYFFTAGEDEVRAWTIQKGTKAPQAAGKIHTDFEKGFIMAEVMAFEDFKDAGSEAAVKAAGKYRQQGKVRQRVCVCVCVCRLIGPLMTCAG